MQFLMNAALALFIGVLMGVIIHRLSNLLVNLMGLTAA
jgi:uncharacterized membrane-anchored protein YhcB (DUF1043 family)